MKKQVLILSAIIIGSLIFVAGCSGDKKTEEQPAQKINEQYRCPMKCTEEKFDKPGNCPVCGMELEKISDS